MGRLRYGMLVSLDGYARDASGSFDWAQPSNELHGYINDRERATGTLVYGRAMWETMRWWQDSPTDDAPEAAPEHRDFAAMWRAADKVIVSSTMTPPPELRTDPRTDPRTGPRTELWAQLDLDRLGALVHESPTDVGIGGPTLAGHALRAGLVDEVTAYVMPHLAGGGLPWLPHGMSGSLVLREHRTFEGGAVALTYDIHRRTS